MLSHRDFYRLVAEANVSDRTLKRFLEGRAVQPATQRQIEETARRLKIELPADVEHPKPVYPGRSVRP